MGLFDYLFKIMHNERMVDNLIQTARTDPARRYDSLVSLKRMGNPKAIDIFCKMLQDPSPRIRKISILALNEIGDSSAIEYLTDLVNSQDFSYSGKRTNYGHTENISLARDAILKIQERDPEIFEEDKPTPYQKMITQGIDLLSQGKLSEAIGIFDTVLSEHPNDAEAFRWKSLAMERFLSDASDNKAFNNSMQKITQKDRIQYPIIPKSQDHRSTDFLHLLIKNHGISVIDNPVTFNGLLKDYSKGEFKKEVRILVISVEEKIPEEIMARKDKVPFAILSGQLIQRLEENGFSKELAEWTVYSWADVLGVKE